MEKNFNPFIAEWVSFVKNQDFSLIEKCLKMSQLLEYPNLSIDNYIQKLDQLAKPLKISIDTTKNPAYLISMLNEYLFQQCGFSGDVEDYYNPKNNFLNEVIDKKSGIPITLSIIYSEIAKHIGIDIKIVGFPGHVLVKYDEETIIDPFSGGSRLEIEDLQDILDRNFGGEVEFSPEFLNEISSQDILTRMVRNLKNAYAQSYSYEKSLLCTNMVLAIQADSAEDIRDKGILEERMLNYETSLKYLNQYLEINPNGEDVDFILELIKSIRSKINQ